MVESRPEYCCLRYLSRNDLWMNISDNELLSIIEDTTLALGQILLRHRALSESLLDTQQTDREKERIDSLRKQIEDERENLARIRHSQQSKRE